VHGFLKKSGALKVDLAMDDVQMLVERLWYDGKITKIRKMGGGGRDSEGFNSMSEDDYGDEEVVEVWMYRAVKGESVSSLAGGSSGSGVWWTDIPCGKCAVSKFCKSGGPVSPEGCVYFNKFLEF
jgi:DNA-directed RNA polymerase III subunit RPC6